MGAAQNGITHKPTAIVIGAGVGGVAVAARLAKAGYDVTVLEKNDFTGGRCSLIHEQGYRFDQGPSLFLLPELFRESFGDLDTTLEDEGIHLVKCNPNYEVYFDDGESVLMSSDLTVMKDQIERWEGPDGFERFLQFLQEAHRHYELSAKHVLHKNFPSFFSILRPGFLATVFAMHPFHSVYGRASRYFRTERLRRVFTFSSMYMGMSPYDAPGTYSLLQYAEIVRAIWYPIGGFWKVIEGLVNIGKRNGVTYRLSTAVVSVNLSPDGKRATGVTLASGESLSSDVVVVNSDLVYSFNNLFPPTSHARSLSKRAASCSSISFYWAMDRILPELQTHNIFLAGDYKGSFNSIFVEQALPEEPSFYVNVPTRVDPTAAPEGKDAIVVLVPVGHLDDNAGQGINSRKVDWDQVVEAARESIFKTVEARTGIRNMRSMVIKEIINTPMIWKEKFNLDQGAILGLSHSFFNVLSLRPSTAHPTINDCFFVGASTHPGTGVPICLAGAKITAEQILRKRGQRVPWAPYQYDARKTSGSKIDTLERRSVLGGVNALLLLLLTAMLAIGTYMYA